MKKGLAVLLSLMIGFCCFSAAAENEAVTDDMPVAGLSFTRPQAFIEAKGLIGTDGALQLTDKIFYAYWYYCAATEEEFMKLMSEDPDALFARTDTLFYVFSVGDGIDSSTLSNLIGDAVFAPENAILIAQEDSWTFYLYITQNPDFIDMAGQEYYDEYTALCGMRDEIISGFSCTVPFNEYAEMDGRIIRFEAKDLEGNTVPSEELFAQNEITMVNIWATWCGPCVGELEELQAIHTRFQEKDCAVLGLMIDDDIEEAKRLIEENGVTYQVVIAPETLGSIFPFDAVPTSFFVDRSGAFLGTKIVGANTDLYETALEPLLEQTKQNNP